MEATTSMQMVGVAEVQAAAARKVSSLLSQAQGDRQTVVDLVFDELLKLGLTTTAEDEILRKQSHLGFEAAAGKVEAREAYFATQELHSDLIGTASAGPVALALSSGAVGSYQTFTTDGGSPTVAYVKAGGNWQGTLAGAGAMVGSIWGPAGAAIGGAVGGVVGKIVDDCKA